MSLTQKTCPGSQKNVRGIPDHWDTKLQGWVLQKHRTYNHYTCKNISYTIHNHNIYICVICVCLTSYSLQMSKDVYIRIWWFQHIQSHSLRRCDLQVLQCHDWRKLQALSWRYTAGLLSTMTNKRHTIDICRLHNGGLMVIQW